MHPPPKPSKFVAVILWVNVISLLSNTLALWTYEGEGQELQAIFVLILLGLVSWLWPSYWRERDRWKEYQRWLERSRE